VTALHRRPMRAPMSPRPHLAPPRGSLTWRRPTGVTIAASPTTPSKSAGGIAATYTRTGTDVAFIISELPGERAEALFFAMAALVSTAGEQFTNEPGHVARDSA
jgi:hypothetical protein